MSIWKDLTIRLAIGISVATLVLSLGGVLGFRVEPTLALVTGAVAGAAFWTFTYVTAAGETAEWQQPHWGTRSAHLQADIRTRRLASVLANAQPGRGFEARGIARDLALLTARRLVTSGLLPRPEDEQDPLAHADAHLSAALLSYLRSAETEHPQVINRKTLHAHLKEIESL